MSGKRKLQKYYMRAKKSLRLSYDTFRQEASTSSDIRSPSHNPIIVNENNLVYSDSSSDSSIENETSIENLQIEETTERQNFTHSIHELLAKSNDNENFDVILADWAIKQNISHIAINGSLSILQKPVPNNLPIDARSLLKTCKKVVTKEIEAGHYYHFGLKNSILNLVQFVDISFINNNIIQININIDGLPITKSTNSQVYPILCSIAGCTNVEMVGIYHGYQKPKDINSFLYDFVEEATDLINNGFLINEHLYYLHVKAFICDASAKSLIKCIKGHTGYHSCTKCGIEGDFIDGRVCFPSLNNICLRTDSEFRSQVDDDHHIGISILQNIPGINMIESFPLYYMHLICLGVMKKLLLTIWCNGRPSTKISHLKCSIISNSLVSLAKCIPLEFNRKPRTLIELKRWKATEFRQFLFYTGPVVLLRNLSKDRYSNFLSLHVAATILSNSKYFDFIDYAFQLLHYFVKTFKILYGPQYISHNVHNLIHIAEDVKNHGPLDNFNAFQFENFLQTILKSIRKNDKVLEQIVKRYMEKRFYEDSPKIIVLTLGIYGIKRYVCKNAYFTAISTPC
ncbi:uncharacterized protein LOC143376535 [Andrena cerasifolii]|uniref:uncharacterized protein LOC143376535 n=1 Tax=Andrena cerasifolii TaxID=2819439 RepID=UPI00403791EA